MDDWTAAMRTNDFEAAWAIAARDLADRDPATRDDPALPYHLRWVWDGTPPDGRDVLLRCYHGLGDTIMFARYLPLLAGRAATLTIETQSALIPLLRGLAPDARWVGFDVTGPLPRSACDIEIMELAFALRMTPAAASPPYLHADTAALPPGTIALCHQTGDWDHARRVPAGLLRNICRQFPCITLVPEPCDLPVRNPEGCTTDVSETAALVAAASLVITVDTMIAHLAGALGRPTWLLLKAAPDWRWSLGRASAWYPRIRFYPQASTGDWAGVIAAVERDLATLG